MKACSKCGIVKDFKDFYIKDSSTGRLHAQCKDCYKEHRKTYYEAHYTKYKEDYRARAKIYRAKIKSEFRSKMLRYMQDKSCKDCGEADIRVLELDHINPALKDFTISQAVRMGKNWDQVESELKKCQVLCSNCHKKRTAKQYAWYKDF